mmetsp:Transcript_26268/g.44011  ORF Transcript_26268/g.44011 Transcript_26268/m.44011 type:complete len:490 (+) Transcript_26268:2878-4347(+)
MALDAVRVIIPLASKWARDSREKAVAVAKAEALEGDLKKSVNAQVGDVRQHYEEQLAKLQADCDEAFKREELARRKAAKAEAARVRMEEDHTELITQLEDRDKIIDDQDKQGRESVSKKDAQLKEAVRAASKLRQELAAAQQESELRERTIKQRDDELTETYAELKEAMQRVSKLEEELDSGVAGDGEEMGASEAVKLELEALRARVRASDGRVQELEEELQTMASLADDFSALQRRYDSQSQDTERAGSALKEMQATIEQMEQDGERAAKVAKEKIEEAQKAVEAAKGVQERQALLESKLNNSESHAQELGRELSGAQRYVLKLENENNALRNGYERMMQKMRELSSEGNMVDRRLVVKLIVTYFQQNYSSDVLDLMARMLQFTDDDKRKVGIGQGVLGSMSSWLASIAGGETHDMKESFDDKNLADLWVDFLMQETTENSQQSPSEKHEGNNTDGKRVMGEAPSSPTTQKGSIPSARGHAAPPAKLG